MSTWHNVKFSRVASAEEVAVRMRISRDRFACGEDENSQEQVPAQSPGSKLKDEQISYLKHILNSPETSATQRDTMNGISLKDGSMLRKQLRELGLVEEVHVNPGVRGKNFKQVRLTQKAKDLLR